MKKTEAYLKIAQEIVLKAAKDMKEQSVKLESNDFAGSTKADFRASDLEDISRRLAEVIDKIGGAQ